MKSQRILSIAALLALSCTLSSCCRSRCEMWEDTKTCGRYMKKGLASLMGRHTDSRSDADHWQSWSQESDYVPLAGAEAYRQLAVEDCAPASREAPGDPGSSIPGIDGFITPSGKLAQLFSHVRFDTDSYSVSGSENVAALRKIANHLSSHPSVYVFVEGHADERGAAAYNLALGSRRANAVRTFLIQNGVNPDQLFTISYGKERPFTQGHEETVWQQNRRSQFRVHER